MDNNINTNKPKKINKNIKPVREVKAKPEEAPTKKESTPPEKKFSFSEADLIFPDEESEKTADSSPIFTEEEEMIIENELQKRPTAIKGKEITENKPKAEPTPVPRVAENGEKILGAERERVSDALENSDTQMRAAVKAEKEPEEKEPESKPKKKGKKNSGALWVSLVKALVYIIAVIVLAAVIGYHIITIANDVFAFVKSTDVVEITIPENATIDDVIKIYADNGIIKYPKIFKLYAKYKKYTDNFEPGTYQISPSTNYDNLVLSLKHKVDYSTVRITIPEGYTVDEIIDLLVSKGISTKEEFVEAINHYEFDFDFVKELDQTISPDRYYRLEGYLFPDTYEFYLNSTAERVIYKMLSNFANKYSDVFAARAQELGYTMDEVITLASMIEKETKYPNEFEYVSSVFHNRLNNPANYPYLDSDATIVYAIQHDTGERPKELTSTDYESPYNTYKNRGLPPGPIANPGYAAILCALYPEKTNYYFFVATGSGSSIFSRTLPEHQAAVWRIKSGQQ